MTDTTSLVLFLACIVVACAGLAYLGVALIRWGLSCDDPEQPGPDPRPPAYTIVPAPPYDWSRHGD